MMPNIFKPFSSQAEDVVTLKTIINFACYSGLVNHKTTLNTLNIQRFSKMFIIFIEHDVGLKISHITTSE